uniref:Uncharacterized protein n=1 Tax=Caenorhabditis tropicalis TaxID=1561998 RepID=A0A1I7V560_9PELO
MSGQNSACDVINTFNHFFTNVPTDKSFDMTYKVYIRDLADIEDRSTLSARSSSVNLSGVKPVVIAAQGVIPPSSASTTTGDLTLVSMPSTMSSSTFSINENNYNFDESIGHSEIDRLCADNAARKDRSMIELGYMNNKYGDGRPLSIPSFVATPPTVYENLSVISSSTASSSSSSSSCQSKAFTEKVREFERMSATEDKVLGGDKLYVKIADCFN